MKKSTLSFRAVRHGSRLFYFLKGKQNRWMKSAFTAAVASCFIASAATAQCNAFRNADEANPLLAVLPAGKQIAGFAFADIDGDGDQDAYVSFNSGAYPAQAGALHLYRNVGTKDHPVYEEDTTTGFGSQLAGHDNEFMQFADIDGDGDLDYFASGDAFYYNDGVTIQFYRNEGTAKVPHFVASPASFFPAGISSYVYQTFELADVDGDGDYDLYVCDISYFNFSVYGQRVYFNKGTKTNPVFDDSYVNSAFADGTDRTYYDWNRDGLLDFFTPGSFFSPAAYWKNVGPKANPQYVKANSEGPTFRNGSPYRMLDLNRDGAPEVFAFDGGYSTLAPVAVIEDSVVTKGGRQYNALYSKYGGSGYYYRWERNGVTLQGSDKRYIVPSLSGTYTLYVTNECGTGVSLNYKYTKNTFFTTEDKVALMENSLSADVSVKAYPNPFVSSFVLQLPDKTCTIKMTDMAGRVLLSQTTSSTTFHTGEKLRPGAYNVQVWQDGKVILQKVMIKQ